MPARPLTPNGKLSDHARHVVLPAGIKTTGWPSVRDKAGELGIRFDPWQHGTGRAILAKHSDGQYAASVGGVVISIPRQVGKTFLLGALVFALCLLFPGLTVVWTAHRLRTAAETFASMQGMAARSKIRPHVAKVTLGAGTESIEFVNGSRILFGARERGFGRGFAKVDVLVFDEAQILTDSAIDDMVPATNQAANPLLLFTGTPPKPTDNGAVFSDKRAKALSGKADDMVYVEFSADRDADPDDREQWAKANPSFPVRTPVAAMQRMRQNLTDDSFMREALGIWDGVVTNGVIPNDAWSDRGDSESQAADQLALGIEVGPDLTWASVGLAGQRADGRWHIELDERRDGAAWVIAYVKALVEANPGIRAVVADVGGPVAGLLEQRSGTWYLQGTKVRVVAPTVKELGSACSMILNLVVTGGLVHIRQPQLDAAVQVAGKRALGDTGMWVFSRKTATTDITPIQSVTLALMGAQMAKPSKPTRTGRSSGRREAVVL